MDNLPVLSAEHLSKKCCRSFRRSLWYGLRDIANELVPTGHSPKTPDLRPAEFWGLRDVSFELRRGESLATVGTNGAGKSPLLELLNGLLRPDAGRVWDTVSAEKNGQFMMPQFITLDVVWNP